MATEKTIISTETLNDIGQTIIDRGGASAPMYPADMPKAIMAIPSLEVDEVLRNDVNFYCPNGRLMYAFSAEQVVSDSWEIPESFIGLDGCVFEGWNMTSAQIKDRVERYGICDVGGIYRCVDALHITLDIQRDDTRYRNVKLYVGQTEPGGVRVDWGDGHEQDLGDTVGMQIVEHDYSRRGRYLVRFNVLHGNLTLQGDTSGENDGFSIFGPRNEYWRRTTVKSAAIGSNVDLRTSAFKFCRRMEYIVIPNGYTELPNSLLETCDSLVGVVIPNTVTTVNSGFVNNDVQIRFISIPDSVTSIKPNCFDSIQVIDRFTLPNDISAMSVQSIRQLKNVSSFRIPDKMNVIPGFTCYGWFSLNDVVLHDRISIIGEGAFRNCMSLTEISLPSGLSEIQRSAFQGCKSLYTIDASRCSRVPALASVDALVDIDLNYSILIPQDLSSEWISATNWCTESISAHIVVKENQ